jgi:hypothetical protein
VRVGIVAAIVAVVLVVVALVVVLVAGDDDEVRTARSGPSTSTVPASTATALGPSTVPPTSAVPPSTDAPAPVGAVLSGSGSFLAPPPSSPAVQSTQPATADCTALGDAGWTVECGRVTMAGGARVWLVERKPQAPTTVWRAFVLTWSQGSGAWLVDLMFANDGAGPGKVPELDLTSVKVKAADLSGDGRPELVFGFRSVGTGQYLSYDVVTDSPTSGPSVGASRQGLAKGQATVANGAITEYTAAYPNNEPTCCPPYVEKRTVEFVGGSFRLVDRGQVPEAVGPFDL